MDSTQLKELKELTQRAILRIQVVNEILVHRVKRSENLRRLIEMAIIPLENALDQMHESHWNTRASDISNVFLDDIAGGPATINGAYLYLKFLVDI